MQMQYLVPILTIPKGGQKPKHKGCGVFSDVKCQWVIHLTNNKNMNDLSPLGSQDTPQPVRTVNSDLLSFMPLHTQNLFSKSDVLDQSTSSQTNHYSINSKLCFQTTTPRHLELIFSMHGIC